MEKKIKLLQDIASEFLIKWDSRGFEWRMANPSASAQDASEKCRSIHDPDNKYKLRNGKEAVTKTDKQNPSSQERSELTTDRRMVHNGREGSLSKRNDFDRQFFAREELTGNNHKPFMGTEQTTPKSKNYDIPIRERQGFTGGKDVSSAGYDDYSQSKTANSTREVRHKEERDGLKPYSSNALPPPYIKPRDKLVPPPYIKSIESKHGVNVEPKHPSSDYDGVSTSHSMRRREDNVVRRSEKIRGEADHANYEEVLGPSRVNSHHHKKDSLHQHDDILLPKPRSVRRKHSKSSSSNDDLGNFEEASGLVKRSSSSRRRGENSSRRGLQILFDDDHRQKDEEERMIDKLLLHYSKKPSTCDPEKVRRKSRKVPNSGEKTPPRYVGRDGHDLQAAMVAPPTRSISLPRDQIAPTEAVKVYTRANSLQPDKPGGCHVHPKLPDYDDLAARFAALRGR
ncbi:hypothetical protein U1Q18_018188 [Sarracenia purpurea var. burkii]